MENKIGIFSTDFKPSNELYIYECGFEHCSPREPYQYEQIDYYLIHYILEGEGLFFMEDKVYHLKAGDGFFIPPNTDNNYYPLDDNPWVYRWIGINGSKAKELLTLCGFYNGNYTFRYTKDNKLDYCFKNIYDSCYSNNIFEGIGYLYQTLSILINENSSSDLSDISSSKSYISKSIEFIESNYHKNITVSDVASYLNIDRSHFYKIFKLNMMTTPQQYIMEYKLKKSCDFLRKSSYSLNQISDLVGFSSQSYFSKFFKKHMNMTPLEYRNLFIK
ncbi:MULTISPECIES: AraC family transcriptional regulator [unclassified Romboutsia]|uniref:AraC family transcriptional regulator n=1 Tax=unclassified Romboutsia TaxID=2626894 RepID=UPI0008227132|nr:MULTISPECIES: AraC family transcriptional regulator [unclassified Romboutsia]SCH82201.1 Melibiose operon regulatory protein [uncultured Clostridium sp.]